MLFMRFFDKSEACISFVEPSIYIHAICRAHSYVVTREVRGFLNLVPYLVPYYLIWFRIILG